MKLIYTNDEINNLTTAQLKDLWYFDEGLMYKDIKEFSIGAAAEIIMNSNDFYKCRSEEEYEEIKIKKIRFDLNFSALATKNKEALLVNTKISEMEKTLNKIMSKFLEDFTLKITREINNSINVLEFNHNNLVRRWDEAFKEEQAKLKTYRRSLDNNKDNFENYLTKIQELTEDLEKLKSSVNYLIN